VTVEYPNTFCSSCDSGNSLKARNHEKIIQCHVKVKSNWFYIIDTQLLREQIYNNMNWNTYCILAWNSEKWPKSALDKGALPHPMSPREILSGVRRLIPAP